MSYISVEGWPTYYELKGLRIRPGRPVVIFFNGWCLSARYWQEIISWLENDFTLLFFDSRGFGRSQAWGARHGYHSNIDSCTREAQQLVKALKLHDQPFHVVGHSLGAVTAAHFAHELQETGRLVSLTIINSGIFDDFADQGSNFNVFVNLFVRLKHFFTLPIIRQTVAARFVARPVPRQYLEIVCEDFKYAEDKLALEVAFSSVEATVLRRYKAELNQCRVELLLVVGDKDSTIPPKGMYNLKKMRPDAVLAAFPRCAHLPMLEQTESFTETLSQHFKRAEVSLQKEVYGS